MAQNIIDPLKQNEKLGASMTTGTSPVQTVTPPTSSPVGISASVKPETSGIGGVASQNAGSMGQDTLNGDASGVVKGTTLRAQNEWKDTMDIFKESPLRQQNLSKPAPVGTPTATAAPPAQPAGMDVGTMVTENANKIGITYKDGKVDTSKLSPEQLAYYNANRNLIDANAAKVAMEQEKAKLDEEAKIGDEEKFGKDVGQAQSDLQRSYDLSKKTAEIQNAEQLIRAKDSLEKLKKNAQYFAGAAGFPQTEQGLKAQSEQIQRAENLVRHIQSLGDLQAQGMSDELATKMRELQEALDSNVSRAVQEALVNVGTLKSMGKLDSVEAINKARADLRETLNTKYNDFLKNAFELSKIAYEKAEKGLEAYQKSKEYSPDFTKQMNDGFIYSANGTKMTDAMGQPLRATQNKEIKTVIDNKNGTQTVLYSDGKYEEIKAGQDTSKAIDEGVTKLLGPSTGFVYNSQGNIITGPDGQPLKYSPESGKKYESVMIEDADGNKVPAAFDPSTGTYRIGQTPSSTVSTPGQPSSVRDFIKAKEGFRSEAYLDAAGVPTIGYGFTSVNGKPVQMGDTMSREEAEVQLDEQLGRYQNFTNFVKVPLNKSQMAALTSFEYNLGSGIWQKDAMPIIDLINKGDFAGAADIMKEYVYAGGKKLNGLVNRRNEEAAMLTKKESGGQYESVARDLVEGNVKASELKTLGYSKREIDQIEKERQRISSGMPTPTVQGKDLALYRSYIEDGKVPAQATLKAMGMNADQFTEIADEGYAKFLEQKAKDVTSANKSVKVEFIPSQYSVNSPTQREKLNESISKIADFDSRMTDLIDTFKESGTELLPTKEKAKMEGLRNQLILKAKEIENLGVLNGPDMGILETLLPETNAIFSFNSNTLAKMEKLRDNYRSDAKTKAINYGAKLDFGGGGTIKTSSGNTYNVSDYE